MIVHITDMALAAQMWPTLEPLIAQVTCHTDGRFAPADVLTEILAGEQQLWVAWDGTPGKVDAVMTTAIAVYPRRKAVRVVYVAGCNMRAWLPEFIAAVEGFAKREGATLLEGSFRRGWGRVWPGAHESGVSITKDLAA